MGESVIMSMELEYEDERERETNFMQLKVNDIILEIPEELIKEREKLLHFDTRSQNIDDLIHEHNIFFKCFLRNEHKYNDTYNQKFIDHLNSELNIYR